MRELIIVLLGDPRVAARREEFIERLGDGFRVVVPPGFSEDALAAVAGDAEVVVGGWIKPAVIRAAPRLRLVQLWIAGVDHLDLDLLRGRGVAVATAHENDRTVAEHALALLLACARGTSLGDRKLRQGDWSIGFVKSGPRPSAYGKTVGILGFGRIGQAFARMAAGFDFTLMGIKRRPDPAVKARFGLAFLGSLAELERVLGEADFVLVALPKTADTIGLLNADRLRKMKPSAYLIQVGRSDVVVEEALYRACEEGWIAGAGIDVWYQYPPPEPRYPSRFPFHELDNVVMTPHCAGWTDEALDAQIDFVVANLHRYRDGKPVEHLLDFDAGY